MKRNIFIIAVLAIFLLLPFVQSAAEKASSSDPSLLNLDRIFKNREFRTKRFGPARWLKHQSGYTTLEAPLGEKSKKEEKDKKGDKKDKDNDKGKDIVRYEPGTGKRFILVSASQLIPEGKKKPLEIDNYAWSDDGKWLMIFTNTKKVWRRDTRGDYWVLNLENKSLWQLGGDAEESRLMFAKFSPDNTRVGYVYKNDLYVQQLSGKPAERKITRLTHDGSTTIINGTSDWVHEEEFFLRDGFRWSPNGKHIAYWQFDAEGIKTFYMINNTDSLYPKLIPVQYPKVGTVNSAGKVGVVPVSGGKTLWFELQGDPRNHYIPKMEWADSSDEIVFQRMNRLQNTKNVMLGNIHTGKVKTVFTDQNDSWVEVDDNLKWMDKGRKFTMVSERDGWRHIYVVSRSGDKVKLATPGDYDILRVLKIDTKGGWVYFTASPESASQRYLYRARLNGKGKPKRLTPMNQPGIHRYQISEDAKWAIHTYSDFDTPPTISLVRLPRHSRVRVLVDNKEVKEKVNALNRKPVEFFRVDIGNGVLLDAWCMKPPGFDADKKYPLLFFVYGEPWNQTVLDNWRGNGYLWYLMLTQRGYLVISVDNRGTPGPKGRDWRKSIYGRIGILASLDQAAAAKAIMKTRPYVDSTRIGIWGWSGGGSMTLNMMFRYPDMYHTGMSVAPVPNQKLYDTIYQERYMGLPKDNKEGYEKGSPITYAHRLKGNLLLVHGTGDDNVHYQGMEMLINKLIEHNKRFTMMSYPNRSHGIYEGKNTTLHLYNLLTRFLMENLEPGPR
jgi:dipeptidyl-peptidase-4